MEPVTARCSQCGYKEVKEFDLVGVALRNAAKAWAAEVAFVIIPGLIWITKW